MKKRMVKLTAAFCILLVVLSMSVMAAAAGNAPYLEVIRDGYVCTVTPKNAPAGSAVYFASYASNGQMLNAETWAVNAEKHQFTIPQDAEYAKAFLIDTATNEPLSEEREVSFLQEIPVSVFDFGEAETATFTYRADKPKEHEPVYSFKAEDGAGYKKTEFTLHFKRQGNDEYEAGKPFNAGTYDVTVTRPADDVYAAFEHTYENVLVINKGTHYNGSMEFVDIKVANRGYTWFEFELVPYGYVSPSEGATITFYVSPDKVQMYPSEEDSNRVRLPEHTGADYNVGVIITDDPNWEDWSSSWRIDYFGEPYNLLPYPTTEWKDQWQDGWFDSKPTDIIITTPAQLATFAEYVNTGYCTFAGKNVYLGADIDLIGHKWNPIGNETTQFQGTFDGQGHTISNLYIDDGNTYAGLFGYTSGDGDTMAEIKNVNLEESLVIGRHNATAAGGIVGRAKSTRFEYCYSAAHVSSNKDGSAVGGIIGIGENVKIFDCLNEGGLEGMDNVGGIAGKINSSSAGLTEIYDCTSRSLISCAGNNTGGIVGTLNAGVVVACANDGGVLGRQGVGGIAGYCSGNNTQIVNCLNHGKVETQGSSYGTGGIAGIVNAGKVYNCANLISGSVTGYSSVGGIVGLNETKNAHIYNCYSAGTVKGSAKGTNWLGIGDGMYTGAIVGRNKSDDGWVSNCYYLQQSAHNYNGYAYGGGTKNGSKDSETHLSTGYFNGWVTNMMGNWYGSGSAPLVDLLNRWQEAYVNNGYPLAYWWVTTDNGYPIPYKD